MLLSCGSEIFFSVWMMYLYNHVIFTESVSQLHIHLYENFIYMNIKKLLYNQPDQSFSFWSVFLFLNLENLTQNCYFFSFPQPESSRKEGKKQYHVLRSLLLYVLIIHLYPTLCDPMDHSPPGSSVHGILQARILEWVAISFSRGCSWPKRRTWVFSIAGKFFTIWATWEAQQIDLYACAI